MLVFDKPSRDQHNSQKAPSCPAAAASSLNLEDASEKVLLEYIQQGSAAERKEAFSTLYQRYREEIWRFIKRKVSCEHDAKDIFSDVWELGQNRLLDFVWREETKSKQPLKSWLYSTARNKVYEHYEKSRKKQERTVRLEQIKVKNQDGEAPESASQTLRNKTTELVKQALATLRPRQREIIALTYYQDQNSTQIGQQLNMKPGTVRQTHSRVLKKLRKILAPSFLEKGENNE